MTDPMDDLRQASAEVSGVEVLSPAAQAVYDVATTAAIRDNADWPVTIAAALRVAADEIDAPLSITHVPEQQQRWYGWGVANFRRKLLAIAAELEGAKAEPPRRHVFPTPHQIAECGGPCEQGGPEACDCGLYERSVSKSTHLEVGDEQ